MNSKISVELLKIKKVRLIEDKLPYENLALMELFDNEELTSELSL